MLFTAVAGILCAQQMAFDSVLKNSQPSLSASLRFTSTKYGAVFDIPLQ